MGNGLNTEKAQFRAFVSYSHADAAVAKKLHRKMEAYKLPKLLRAMQVGGKEDGRLGQLFRDREDLPAALDLSESVKAALAQSQVLIVLCSPNAKSSPWVAREIELFRELHPHRPILAALVAGEPEDSFPPALTQEGEPLAADLRREGDGWRLGLLKLIAGVAEVPLDALIQRDAQRHIRSVMAVTLVVGTALLTMIGMTIFAVQQRNEAQHQQAQAEGLVEYMLTDLRSDLRGVGRLDVMTRVNERAMDYYEDQADLSDMPAESLERRARIFEAMGQDDERRKKLKDAEIKYKKMHSATFQLLKKEPDNPERIYAHANSESRLALTANTMGNWQKAVMGFFKSKDMLSKLGSWDNAKGERRRLAGYVYGSLCAIYLKQDLSAETALKFCEQSLQFQQEYNDYNPDPNKAIYDSVFSKISLSDALEANGRLEEAMATKANALALNENLVQTQPLNSMWKEQRMELHLKYGRKMLKESRNIEAKRYLQIAKSISDELVHQDSENRLWADNQRQILNLIKGD